MLKKFGFGTQTAKEAPVIPSVGTHSTVPSLLDLKVFFYFLVSYHFEEKEIIIIIIIK